MEVTTVYMMLNPCCVMSHCYCAISYLMPFNVITILQLNIAMKCNMLVSQWMLEIAIAL